MHLPNPLQLSLIFSSLTLDSPPPKEAGVALHPNGISTKCLDVIASEFKNGTPVQIHECNDTGAQKWVFDNCEKQLRVANTNFCLDAATSDPTIGTKLKIWQCQENVAAQAWFHTANNHIVLFGKDVCVDAPGGILTNGMVVHTWPCEEHNTNQLWAS